MEVAGCKQGDEDPSEVSAKQDRYCQPCTIDDELIIAVGYCRQCNEFICQPCVKAHRKSKATKSHDILEGDDMPEAPLAEDPIDVALDSYEVCETHSSPDLPLAVKYYCSGHDQVGCGDCMVISHNSCKTDFIKDVAKTFDVNKEFDNLKGKLTKVDNQVGTCQTTIKQVYEANTCIDLKAMEDAREFATEMTTYIGQKGEELLEEIGNKKDTDERNRKAKVTKCSKAREELVGVRNKIQTGTMEANKAFAVLKHSKSVVQQIEKRIQDIETDTDSVAKRRNYTFQRDPALVAILSSEKPLGTLKTIKDITKAKFTHVQDIDIHFKDNKETGTYNWISVTSLTGMSPNGTCNWISGMAFMSPNVLIIVDYRGETVIAVDLTTKKVVSSLKMSCGPADVAVLPNNELAVTLRCEKKIQILRYQNGTLSKLHHLTVSDKCLGIDYSNSMLVVTYDEAAKVEIMNLKGDVIKSIQKNNNDALFTLPEYAKFTNSGENILVSDRHKNTVTCLSSHGQVLDTHKLNVHVSGCKGIFCCSDGTTLICGETSNNIAVMSQNGSPKGVILAKDDWMRNPQVVVVSEDMETMYVGCIRTPLVKVYKLTYD